MPDYTSNYGTIASNGATWTLSGNTGSAPAKTPSGLIVTAAAQTKKGWLGQVIVDKAIVWETGAYSKADDAIDAANQRVVKVIKSLFKAGTESDDE